MWVKELILPFRIINFEFKGASNEDLYHRRVRVNSALYFKKRDLSNNVVAAARNPKSPQTNSLRVHLFDQVRRYE